MAGLMFATWRKRRACFHHNHRSGKSWIESRLIDMGSRKMFWCIDCGRTWIA